VPGENLQKLTKAELKELRLIVKRIYYSGAGPRELAAITNRELDSLIDSFLPSTVEKCKEMGEAKGFISSKNFFLPSRIVNGSGKPIMREDRRNSSFRK